MNLLKKIFSFISSKKINNEIKGEDNTIEIDRTSIHNNLRIKISGNNNSIKINKNTLLSHVKIIVYGNNNEIIIGEDVKFKREENSIYIEDDGTLLNIGKKTTFESVHIAVTETNSKMIIGEDCMFAYDIDIRTGDSHSIINKDGERINLAKDIFIGNHVWVGSHVSILKGAFIKDNVIVATRSVVTNKVFNSGTIIGGIPCKILKENIDWKRERI